jgi:hypothetical protein
LRAVWTGAEKLALVGEARSIQRVAIRCIEATIPAVEKKNETGITGKSEWAEDNIFNK